MAGSLVTNYLAQGTAAARPATPTAATGTLSLYFATDTETLSLYDWNDGAWQDLSTAGTTFCSTTEQLAGTETNKASNPDTVAALWEKGSDIASPGTISIGEGGFFHVTGTTTITDIDFGTDKSGRSAILVFDDALTLTHNATSLILPTGANIVTAAGDACRVVSEDGSNNVRIVWYQRKDGGALTGLVLLSSQVASGSASFSFTSIPGTFKDLILSLSGRSNRAATSDIVNMRFNNDSSSIYNWSTLGGDGNTVTSTDGQLASSARFAELPGTSVTAGYPGSVEGIIPNYAGTTFMKDYTSVGGLSIGDSNNNENTRHFWGMWKSTSAITRIDLIPNVGTAFVDGTVATLYGRR